MRKTTDRQFAAGLIPPAIALACGGVVALATFVPVWWLQLLPFICIAPIFVVLKDRTSGDAYILGLCFFAAWLLPTTYWYYSFMPWWLAVLAGIGFVTLIANVFRLFSLDRRAGSPHRWGGFPFSLRLALVVAGWFTLTFARLHLPVLEDWWIPHLGYAVWRNTGVLPITHIAGEAALEALVLAVNAVLAWLAANMRRHGVVAAVGVGSLVLISGLDFWAWRTPAPALPNLVAVQQATSGGVDVPADSDDVGRLRASSQTALDNQSRSDIGRGLQNTIIVWPENSLPQNLRPRVSRTARDLGAAIVYDTVEQDGSGNLYKRVVLVDAEGHRLLSNFKLHMAPDDPAGTGRYSKESASLNGLRVTAYACYDMHYPNSVKRTQGTDIVFVPINDAAYGRLQQQFHEADLTFRAVQSHTTIVAAGTTGPTAVILPTGAVVRELPANQDGTIVFTNRG